MRHAREIIFSGWLLALAACQSAPHGEAIAPISEDARLVSLALSRWPKPAKGEAIKRPFFATIHAAGTRTTASGMLQYYGPRDFRLTAVTEMGVILFDGRVNWAGPTVLRQMPGLDRSIIETLLADLTRAFEVPSEVEGLKAAGERIVLERKAADTHRYTWKFDRKDGILRETEVSMGLFDTLRVEFNAYTKRGWPSEMRVVRKARLYEVAFTFTSDEG